MNTPTSSTAMEVPVAYMPAISSSATAAPATDAPTTNEPVVDGTATDTVTVDTTAVGEPAAEPPAGSSPLSESTATPDSASEEAAAPSAGTTPVEPDSTSTSQKRKADDVNSDGETVVSKRPKNDSVEPKQRQRRKSGKAIAFKAIPRSYKDCEDYDKCLIDMYAANKSWPEIREGWRKITGEGTATSTLPNRYQRLMNNFTVIPDTDKVALIVAKQKIEKQFEDEKWSKIAEEMEIQGTCLYQGIVLERQHKKMMLEAEDLPPVGSTSKKKKKEKYGSNVDIGADDETIMADD